MLNGNGSDIAPEWRDMRFSGALFMPFDGVKRVKKVKKISKIYFKFYIKYVIIKG